MPNRRIIDQSSVELAHPVDEVSRDQAKRRLSERFCATEDMEEEFSEEITADGLIVTLTRYAL